MITLPASRSPYWAMNCLKSSSQTAGTSTPARSTASSTLTHFRVAAQAGRDLRGGVLVAAGQQEVLTACREVRREPAADIAGADDGNRGIRNSHLGHTFRDVVSYVQLEHS